MNISIIISIFTNMKINSYHVIGAMSGTSVDGLDLCYVHFEFQNGWAFKILKSATLAYSEDWISKLSTAYKLSSAPLKQLDIDFTIYLADRIDQFINSNGITNLDCICSHGHTVLHQPENRLTYQIGNLDLLAERLKKTVVCDFRVQDVAFGGQGAPLVPIGDKLLFGKYDICLNLGGFANLSFDQNDKRLAFDICPVNIVLNNYAKKEGFQYDDGGEIAKSGKLNQKLFDELNQLAYYKKPAPKSLGIEWVKSMMLPLIDTVQLSNRDVLRTLVEHIAIQLSKILNIKVDVQILVSGGGAYNAFLMDRLKFFTIGEIVVPEDEIVNFKEALIFGLLGVLKLRNEVNCLQSVTGARHDHSSGVIFHG